MSFKTPFLKYTIGCVLKSTFRNLKDVYDNFDTFLCEFFQNRKSSSILEHIFAILRKNLVSENEPFSGGGGGGWQAGWQAGEINEMLFWQLIGVVEGS